MDIFPIGTVAGSSSNGTIDSISYSMFEPNKNCKSSPVYNVLSIRYEQQTLATRKKSEPYLTVLYEYDNIYDREFRQIEHFIDDKEDSLTSFFLIDWSHGQTPTAVTDSSGDWIVSIANTRLYSTITNNKAYKVVLWDGSNWKEGSINSISANTSVTVDVDTNEYGALTVANANLYANIYPLYQVYCAVNSLSSFVVGEYFNESVSISKDGGFMRTGNISFMSKYKV